MDYYSDCVYSVLCFDKIIYYVDIIHTCAGAMKYYNTTTETLEKNTGFVIDQTLVSTPEIHS
jgi:hypothetical protein